MINKLPNNRFKKDILGFPKTSEIYSQLNELTSSSAGKVFIFPPPGCPWGYMFQRPQQIAVTLATLGHTVIYCVDLSFPEEPDWSTRGLKEILPRLFLYNDGVDFKTLFKFSSNFIVWQYWPHQSTFALEMKKSGSGLIYDNIDNLQTFTQYPNIDEDYFESMKKADLVLTTADYIDNETKKIREDTLLVPNAVHIQDFQQYNENFSIKDIYVQNLIDSLKRIKQLGNNVIGYYGALADWVDFELIHEIAKKNPSWIFVFIGQKYPKVMIPKLPNIMVFDRISYNNIPSILDIFDVAILPFKINDITLHTSPVKVFEYMAGLKPVVSTDLPEIRKYDPIFIASGEESFAFNIHLALKVRDNEDYIKSLKNCASVNTWNIRVCKVVDKLREKDIL